MSYPVLVLGGYGNFGGKITEALVQSNDISVSIAGRNPQSAARFSEQIKHKFGKQISCIVLDIQQADLACLLKSSGAKLVIHTSGPFQGQNYHVATACIDAGINYIDLADGRDFVRGFKALDDAARDNNVMAVTGASSVPGLSSAVINEFLAEFKELHSVEYGIAPGNKADRGEATVKAILSYTGKHFTRFDQGRWQSVRGWQDIHRQQFPQPIGNRWLANCDIPDLELFPHTYPDLRSVKFLAGLELSVMHLGLWFLSWFSTMGIVKDWSRYSKAITVMSTWFEKFGTDVGGMYMLLQGIDNQGNLKKIRWDLVAEEGHGPQIPTIASIVLAKKLAKGSLNIKGAMPCVGLFSLNEFTNEVADLNIWQQVS